MKLMLKYLKFWLAAVFLFGIIFPSGYLVDLICGTYPIWPELVEMCKVQYNHLKEMLK